MFPPCRILVARTILTARSHSGNTACASPANDICPHLVVDDVPGVLHQLVVLGSKGVVPGPGGAKRAAGDSWRGPLLQRPAGKAVGGQRGQRTPQGVACRQARQAVCLSTSGEAGQQ